MTSSLDNHFKRSLKPGIVLEGFAHYPYKPQKQCIRHPDLRCDRIEELLAHAYRQLKLHTSTRSTPIADIGLSCTLARRAWIGRRLKARTSKRGDQMST